MNTSLILWPVLAQVTLTLAVFFVLSARKAAAIKLGHVDRERTALHNDAWPDEVLKASNNLQNQFQTPVLFYALSLAFLYLGTASSTVLILAWGYVVSRILHAWIHLGSNYVPRRFQAFLVGFAILIALAVMLAIQLASPPSTIHP